MLNSISSIGDVSSHRGGRYTGMSSISQHGGRCTAMSSISSIGYSGTRLGITSGYALI